MDYTYQDVTLEEVQTEEFEELVYKVVEGWFLDDRMDFERLCDRVDDGLRYDEKFRTSPSVVKVLPGGDIDQPIYKHLRKLARKAKNELSY